jgi:hypothetical protein
MQAMLEHARKRWNQQESQDVDYPVSPSSATHPRIATPELSVHENNDNEYPWYPSDLSPPDCDKEYTEEVRKPKFTENRRGNDWKEIAWNAAWN